MKLGDLVDVPGDRRSVVFGGRLILCRVNQAREAPLLDGGTTWLSGPGVPPVDFGVLVIGSGPRAVGVGWRDALPPRPDRWARRLRAVFHG